MCAPPFISRPVAPPAQEVKSSARKTGTDVSVRRVGKTLRQASPSQRGRGVLIKSKTPLGINPNTKVLLGTRRSLLVPLSASAPVTFTIGGY